MFFKKKLSTSKKIIITLSLILLLLASTPITYFYIKNNYGTNNPNLYDNIIILKANKYCLDPNLIKSVIWRESRFNPNIVGAKNEIGLMQITKNSAVKDWEHYYKIKLEGKGVLFYPELNIEIGCWYLARCRRHWRQYSNPEILMLAEYNAGYSNVKKWVKKYSFNTQDLLKIVEFKTTKSYIIKILEKYKYYSENESLK